MRRDILLRLNQWKDSSDRKPLILKGARQVGKTYVLQEFGKESFANYHYVNFEEGDEQLLDIFNKKLDPKNIIQGLELYLKTKINIGKDLLIFDEVQSMPRVLTSLKYFCEKMPEIAICAAGSLLGVQLSQASFPVGKVQSFYMFPMTFAEFLNAVGEDRLYEMYMEADSSVDTDLFSMAHSFFWEQLKIYFVVGGLPELVQTYVDNKDNLLAWTTAVRAKQNELIDNYLDDIAKHSGKLNAMHVQSLWKNIPQQLAKEEDASSSRYQFKGVIPEIKGYSRLANFIDWLLAAGLIIKVPMINNAELPLSAWVQGNQFKLFMFDVGILGAMSGLEPKSIFDYDYGTYKGYFAENFVLQEFVCVDGRADRNYSWKTSNTAEVEFVRVKDAELLPIEVKSGWKTQAKSLKVFAEKYKPPYRTIMSAKNLNIDSENGVHNYPIYLAGKFPLL